MSDKNVITQKDSPHVIEYARGYNLGVKDEMKSIIGLLEELKIDDAFHERWNDMTSDGEDVLSNTIEMIIGEIKKAKT